MSTFVSRWTVWISGLALALTFAFLGTRLASGAESERHQVDRHLSAWPASDEVLRRPRAAAKSALDRADQFRAKGDEFHAGAAEALAAAWVAYGEDLREAIVEEKGLRERQLAIQDAGASIDREKSRIEEQMAENGRLRVRVSEAERTLKLPHEARDGGR